MRKKPCSSTKGKKKKIPDYQLDQFKEATSRLIANKIFYEFIMESECFGHVGVKQSLEPEHYFDEWMKRNTINKDTYYNKWIWIYFLDELKAFRKNCRQ